MALSTPVKAPFADTSAFVADTNAINAATKTALNTGLANIRDLFVQVPGASCAHPDFVEISPKMSAAIVAEINALIAEVTAHA